MSAQLPEPAAVEETIVRILQSDVSCRRTGDVLLIDTPLPVLTGHLLQVVLDASSDNGLVVSDGGFVQRQAEILSSSPSILHSRSAEIQRIAHRLDFEWKDYELRFSAPDLNAVALRLATMVEVVDRALAVLQVRTIRRAVELRKRLAKDLKAIEGIKVRSRAPIPLEDERRTVKVAFLARRNGTQAAIEVLSGRTESGAEISVNRAIANFQLLSTYNYKGAMLGVYDEDSPAAKTELQERFRDASPKKAVLVSGEGASAAVQERLKL
jgi:hypothetical protein